VQIVYPTQPPPVALWEMPNFTPFSMEWGGKREVMLLLLGPDAPKKPADDLVPVERWSAVLLSTHHLIFVPCDATVQPLPWAAVTPLPPEVLVPAPTP
jgi:hypothetical protein